MAGWLSQLEVQLRQGRSLQANATKWKLLHYKHRLQAGGEGNNAFLAWLSCITPAVLAEPMWVSAFASAATISAAVVEDAAGRLALAKWRSWLQEGPSKGLGRQHKYTRNAIGWTSTKVGPTEEPDIGDLDELDGLTAEELASIWRVEELKSPLAAQQVAEAEMKSWGGQWNIDGT